MAQIENPYPFKSFAHPNLLFLVMAELDTAIHGQIPGLVPRLSGSILVDKAHGIATTRFGTFGDGPDTGGQCHAAQE
jgi:hypothetical protein